MKEGESFEKLPEELPIPNQEEPEKENIGAEGPESPENNLTEQPQEKEGEKSLSDYLDIAEQQEREAKPRSRYGTTTGKAHFPRAPILSMRNIIKPKGIRHPLSSGTKFTGPGRKHHPRKTA